MNKWEFKKEIEVNGKKSILVMGDNVVTQHLKKIKNENEISL